MFGQNFELKRKRLDKSNANITTYYQSAVNSAPPNEPAL